MNVEGVEAKIRSAVADAKAKGWRIIKNSYFDGTNGCCPLAACVLDEIAEASLTASIPERAARVLGVSTTDTIRIAVGIDGSAEWAKGGMYDVGARLRDLVGP